MNYNYDIHQITDQKTTVDRVSSPSQPSVGKVPPPFKLRVPFVAQVVGVLSALVLVAGAMTTRQLISTNTLQDTAAADIKAEIYLEPETSNLNINQEKTIELRIKTNGLKLNGTDFTLHFDKSFITISDPQFVNGAFPVPVESPVIDNAAGTVKAVLVNLEEEVTDADVLVMTMKVKAKTELGSTLITIDPDVMITAQEELVNVAKIKGNGASLTIADQPNVTPTPTPIPTPTPTPTTPTPTPTTPTPTPTTPTPTPSEDLELVTSFQMQGVIKEGITLPFVFSIKYTPNDDSPNLNPQTLTIKQTLTSNENGDFTSDPISLKGINPGEIKDDQIEIFVKTDTSLRKKLGAISIISTNNRLTLISEKILLVGDLVRGEVSGKNESNKITILDVSQILDHYTQLDTPVTDDNREYDLDFNDMIDIFDISIVISNYTNTVVWGDTL